MESTCDARSRSLARPGWERSRRSPDGRGTSPRPGGSTIGLLRAFHAADAFIVDRTGNIAKTHRGVHSEFARLIKDRAEDDRRLGRVLADGYRYKELAGYSADSEAVITDRDAAGMIDAAPRFVARVAELLAASPSAGRP